MIQVEANQVDLQNQDRYSKKGLWLLFLITALPLHAWTIILFLRDFSWLVKSRNVWDSIGVGSYELIFVFFESILIFGIMILLGYFLPKQWIEKKRNVFLATFYMTISFWLIIYKIYEHYQDMLTHKPFFQLFIYSNNSLKNIYITILILAFFSVFITLYIVIKCMGVINFLSKIYERFSILSACYIFFDVIGAIVIIIRNIKSMLK